MNLLHSRLKLLRALILVIRSVVIDFRRYWGRFFMILLIASSFMRFLLTTVDLRKMGISSCIYHLRSCWTRRNYRVLKSRESIYRFNRYFCFTSRRYPKFQSLEVDVSSQKWPQKCWEKRDNCRVNLRISMSWRQSSYQNRRQRIETKLRSRNKKRGRIWFISWRSISRWKS